MTAKKTEMRRNGWIPDRPDGRDTPYKKLRPQNRLLKAIVRKKETDLRESFMPAVYNQGTLGSCGPNVACAYAAFTEASEGNAGMQFSRLAMYYDVRRSYGKTQEDTGVQIRDLFKSIRRSGLPVESKWPYDLARWKEEPSKEAWAEGEHRKCGLMYYRLTSQSDILDCLSEGWPVAYGMVLYDSFDELPPDNVVPMPGPDEAVTGGHALLLSGYSLPWRRYLFRNSWGSSWGMGGYAWLPFEYITRYARDFWTLRYISK